MQLFQIDKTYPSGLCRALAQSCLVSALLSITPIMSTPVYAAERQCQIADISNGFATIFRQDETLRKPIGLSIQQGDRLRKSASAQVSITCSDGGEITIGRATEVDLGALIATPVGENRIFQILRGIAGFVMPGQAAPVEIKTLNAVASVRSTEWTVEVDGDVTHVFVREGLVQVTGISGQTAPLGDGEGVSVLADGTLGPVKSWGQSRIDAMNARLGGDWR
ncbi:MAG: FecR family protein [Paracoccaceae bacterium]